MTTPATVAGRTLSGWTRPGRHGTWHALSPTEPGGPVLGALRIDRALLTPDGTRERLAAAVLAVAKLRLPGVLGTVDLVAEAGEVWLITARPPAPTLADLLARGGTGLDAGSAASVLNETAQSLLALHARGLAHGALDPDTVVLAPDGVALLGEVALGVVLGDGAVLSAGAGVGDGVGTSSGPGVGEGGAPGGGTGPRDGAAPACREADVAAWAELCRALGEAWASPGTPAAALFARCSATAGSQGLAAARAALVAGRAALPAGFLQRTELRAAVAAAGPDFSVAPGSATDTEPEGGAGTEGAAPESEVRAEGGVHSGGAGAGTGGFTGTGSGSVVPGTGRAAGAQPQDESPRGRGSAGTEPGDVIPGADGPGGAPAAGGPDPQDRDAVAACPSGAAPQGAGVQSGDTMRTSPRDLIPESVGSGQGETDEQLTMPGRRRSAARQQRHSADSDDQATVLGKRHRSPAEPLQATPDPVGEGGDGGEILLRFGPGVPLEDRDRLRAQWSTAPPVPSDSRPRRRRRRAWIATTTFLAVAAVLLWLLLRPSPAPTVTAVEVRAPAGRLHCGQTADLVGVVTTDGSGGAVTYHWLRSDGHDSGELVRMARKGERRVTVHLRWTVRGPGSFRGTARLRVAQQSEPAEAEATFRYVCS
ncbi:hypothetical protein ACWD4F_16975 [Streptomyces aureus]